MIDAAHRFHGRGSLHFVYQHGKTIRGPYSSLRFVRNQRRKTYRMAVVVSRKVHKSAVVRNRIRRRIYELVRGVDEHITTPYDLVFTVYSDQVAEQDSAELAEVVYRQLRTAGVLSGEGELDLKEHAIVDLKERKV